MHHDPAPMRNINPHRFFYEPLLRSGLEGSGIKTILKFVRYVFGLMTDSMHVANIKTISLK